MNDKHRDEDTSAPSESPREAARGAQGIFPMRVAVQLTGLTPDTIRAWERRYHAIEPVRSAGNTRKFTHDDIRRLLLLREATEAGHSIGNIAELAEAELVALSVPPAPLGRTAAAPPTRAAEVAPRAEPAALAAQFTAQIAAQMTGQVAPGVAAAPGPAPAAGVAAGLDTYLELLERFDVAQSGAWLRRVAALHTPRAFVLEVVAPLLGEIRERRADARLGGPHAVVAWQALTATLHVLLDVTPAPRGAPEIVTVGAPRQRHAIAAMAAAVLARAHGREALFLAPAVPDTDLLWAVDALGARVAVVDLSVPLTLDLGPSSFATLERMGARQPVWVMWPAGLTLEPAHVARVVDLHEVDARLAALGPRPGGG